jgi:hypothetical protein
MTYKYFPVLRSRQQEMDVLEKFDFGDSMIPVVEIIKEKARLNQKTDGHTDYADTFASVHSEKVVVDLPIYLDPTINTATEVRKFFLSTISDLSARIQYFKHYRKYDKKVIPTISILQPHSDEANTLITQFRELSPLFPQLAIRLYLANFDQAMRELSQLKLRPDDYILYDLDTTDLTSPLVKIQKRQLDSEFKNNEKIVIRSAINTDIQNVKLNHGNIIPEANNSLLELFNRAPYFFSAFGDYAGVKKDDITSGGTISPGFIFFNPEENLYYGFRGRSKSLSEFETTIVPDVLNSKIVRDWIARKSPFIIGNPGYQKLVDISNGETGKSQAKFKWISIMHYLHCIKVLIQEEMIS